MKPTPRIVVGVVAVAATAATVGTRSDTSAMSTSMPMSGRPASASDGGAPLVGGDGAAHRLEQLDDGDVALGERRVRPATVTGTARTAATASG